MYRDTCTHRHTAKVCTHTGLCVQLAIISLAIPMNVVMGKRKCATELLLAAGAVLLESSAGFCAKSYPWHLLTHDQLIEGIYLAGLLLIS